LVLLSVIGVGEGANGGEDISGILAEDVDVDKDVEKPRGPCHLAFGAGAKGKGWVSKVGGGGVQTIEKVRMS
jgi:hypothetical protein